MDSSSTASVLNFTQAIMVPLSALMFALAFLVLAIAMYHLIRAQAAISQLRGQLALESDEQADRRQRMTAPRPSNFTEPKPPSFGDDDETLEAIRMAREGRNPAGAPADVTTMDENAQVRDEEPPIGGSGFYSRGE